MQIGVYPTTKSVPYAANVRVTLEREEYEFLRHGLKDPRINFEGDPTRGVRVYFSDDRGFKMAKAANSERMYTGFSIRHWNLNPVWGRVRSFKTGSKLFLEAKGRELRTKPFADLMASNIVTSKASIRAKALRELVPTAPKPPELELEPPVQAPQADVDAIKSANEALDAFNAAWQRCAEVSNLELSLKEGQVMLRNKLSDEQRLKELSNQINWMLATSETFVLKVDEFGKLCPLRKVVTYENI